MAKTITFTSEELTAVTHAVEMFSDIQNEMMYDDLPELYSSDDVTITSQRGMEMREQLDAKIAQILAIKNVLLKLK